MGKVYQFPERYAPKRNETVNDKISSSISELPLFDNQHLAFSSSGNKLKPKASQISQAAEFDDLTDESAWRQPRPSL